MCYVCEISSCRDKVRGAVAYVVKSASQRVAAAPPLAQYAPADVMRRSPVGLTLETSHALAQIDQGNVHTELFIVWDPQDSLTDADALERMTSAYQAIVADITLQVPLLYRWKHALPAFHVLLRVVYCARYSPGSSNTCVWVHDTSSSAKRTPARKRTQRPSKRTYLCQRIFVERGDIVDISMTIAKLASPLDAFIDRFLQRASHLRKARNAGQAPRELMIDVCEWSGVLGAMRYCGTTWRSSKTLWPMGVHQRCPPKLSS